MINKAPKYGNDDDLVDDYAAWVWETFFDAFQQYTNAKGGQFHPTCQTMSANVPSGEKVGALPNGRRAREPLVDNTSPGPGLDVSGVTAVIKSVTKCHRTRNSTTGAGLVNLKFHPHTLAGQENLAKFADLALTFNELGGWQVQFNVISSETLKQAQKNPEQYRDLVVKVAGYNAQFIMLGQASSGPNHCQNRVPACGERQMIAPPSQGQPRRGVVFNIERYMVDDGPGIRTVVFLKGCPLRCLWCCNPESQRPGPELMAFQDKCIGCGRCLEVCPSEAIAATDLGKALVDLSRCTACAQCAEACPSEAMIMSGRTMTSDEVVGGGPQGCRLFQEIVGRDHPGRR